MSPLSLDFLVQKVDSDLYGFPSYAIVEFSLNWTLQ